MFNKNKGTGNKTENIIFVDHVKSIVYTDIGNTAYSSDQSKVSVLSKPGNFCFTIPFTEYLYSLTDSMLHAKSIIHSTNPRTESTEIKMYTHVYLEFRLLVK